MLYTQLPVIRQALPPSVRDRFLADIKPAIQFPPVLRDVVATPKVLQRVTPASEGSSHD